MAQLSLRSLGRVSMIVVPLAIAMIVWFFISNRGRYVDEREAKTDELKDLKTKLANLTKQNDSYTPEFVLRDTVSGWSEATCPWSMLVSNVMVNTPTNVQYATLILERTKPYSADGVPTRRYRFTLGGVALTDKADASINELNAMLKTDTYTSIVERVTVEADFASELNKVDRQFVLTLTTKPRLFYAPTK